MNTQEPVVLFDGVCNFCNGTINFLIRMDKQARLRFAPLQSQSGKALLERHQLPGDFIGSFILVEKSKVYQKSTASLKLLPYLSWYWQWARLGWIVPRFLRDCVYDLIARNRYKWFGKKEACMIPSPEVRSRFLSLD
jgi:predicted DCC family thiol-disulfide oxidoreductase YuxK